MAPMTAYEIISIFIGILALLMSFGSLIVALLVFLDNTPFPEMEGNIISVDYISSRKVVRNGR